MAERTQTGMSTYNVLPSSDVSTNEGPQNAPVASCGILAGEDDADKRAAEDIPESIPFYLNVHFAQE